MAPPKPRTAAGTSSAPASKKTPSTMASSKAEAGKPKKSAAASGLLPAIGGAVAGAAIAGAIVSATNNEDEGEQVEERQVPSPPLSLAASQTTEELGGSKTGGESEWEQDQQRKSSVATSGDEAVAAGGTETRPTPEPPFLEQQHTVPDLLENEDDINISGPEVNEEEEEKTARVRRSVPNEEVLAFHHNEGGEEIDATTPAAESQKNELFFNHDNENAIGQQLQHQEESLHEYSEHVEQPNHGQPPLHDDDAAPEVEQHQHLKEEEEHHDIDDIEPPMELREVHNLLESTPQLSMMMPEAVFDDDDAAPPAGENVGRDAVVPEEMENAVVAPVTEEEEDVDIGSSPIPAEGEQIVPESGRVPAEQEEEIPLYVHHDVEAVPDIPEPPAEEHSQPMAVVELEPAQEDAFHEEPPNEEEQKEAAAEESPRSQQEDREEFERGAGEHFAAPPDDDVQEDEGAGGDGEEEVPVDAEQYGVRGRRATGLEADQAEQIRRIVHPNMESEHGPTESVRSLASSSTNETRMDATDVEKQQGEGKPIAVADEQHPSVVDLAQNDVANHGGEDSAEDDVVVHHMDQLEQQEKPPQEQHGQNLDDDGGRRSVPGEDQQQPELHFPNNNNNEEGGEQHEGEEDEEEKHRREESARSGVRIEVTHSPDHRDEDGYLIELGTPKSSGDHHPTILEQHQRSGEEHVEQHEPDHVLQVNRTSDQGSDGALSDDQNSVIIHGDDDDHEEPAVEPSNYAADLINFTPRNESAAAGEHNAFEKSLENDETVHAPTAEGGNYEERRPSNHSVSSSIAPAPVESHPEDDFEIVNINNNNDDNNSSVTEGEVHNDSNHHRSEFGGTHGEAEAEEESQQHSYRSEESAASKKDNNAFLLAQPSIEITPASEIDKLSESSLDAAAYSHNNHGGDRVGGVHEEAPIPEVLIFLAF